MPMQTFWRLMLWATTEARRRRITMSQLLNGIRERIDEQVLGETVGADASIHPRG